jgi:hypothetical protein
MNIRAHRSPRSSGAACLLALLLAAGTSGTAQATHWVTYGRDAYAIELDIDSVARISSRGLPLVAYADGHDPGGADMVVYVMGGDCTNARGTLYIRHVPPSATIGENYPFDLKADSLTTTQVDAIAAVLCSPADAKR